jgi:hypothetical protein
MKLSERLTLCINDLIFLQFDPSYKKDWEDAETSLADILVRLQILQDTIQEVEGYDNN